MESPNRNSHEWIDVDAVLDRVTYDWEFLEEMVDVFAAHAPNLLQAIRDAITQGNAREVKLSAHALKGAVSCWSTHAPYRLVIELEHVGGQGRMAAAAALLEELTGQVAVLIAALREFVTEGAQANRQRRATNPSHQEV